MHRNPMEKVILPLLFLLPAVCTAQTFYFDYSPTAKQAYEKVFSLRFQEADQLLAQMRNEEPNNLIIHHIENYMDFYKVYINEDDQEFKRLKSNKSKRLARIKQGDSSSPYYYFLQAEIRLQWALARLKFGEYLTSFTEVNKAYKQLKKNQELFPDFMPNLKDLGILHAMVGTIPDNYQWSVKLLSSLEGTIDQGKEELERVLAYSNIHEFIFEQEAKMLYALLLLHLDNDKVGAWRTVNDAGLSPKSNPLHCFIMANIAMRTGQNNEAIRLLEACPRDAAFHPMPYLDFMLGTAKLRNLDVTASNNLQDFVTNFKGKNFIKEAYQKLAWCELIAGKPSGYNQMMQACREKGVDETGSDKNALREASSGILPDQELLKARLLFDGGYYQKAYDLLYTKQLETFTRKEHQLEYIYRMGRICHGMESWSKALYYYNLTIAKGKEEKFYFACNAALQKGLIYEIQGDLKQAKANFQLCLNLNPDEYKTGLHQMAKAGLGRIKNRMQ